MWENAYSKNVVGRVILRRELGDDCFDDDGDSVGRFWLLLPTRPYMRVLQSLVKVYHDSGRIEDSAYVYFDSIPLQTNWTFTLAKPLSKCCVFAHKTIWANVSGLVRF